MTNQEPKGLTNFKSGWYSFDLGRYRPCDSTYCLYPYESIPPIGAPDETLSWLGPLSSGTDDKMEIHRNPHDARGRLDEVAAHARQLGLIFPESFKTLMASPELQDRIPSCTACYFQLGERILPCPESEGGYIVCFLHDQQDVLLWYLYLTPRGEHCVLVSAIDFEELAGAQAEQTPEVREQWRQAIRANTFVCAPSFASFMYRFWLENSIWFKLDSGDQMTADEQRYLAHYSQRQGTVH